MSNDTTRDAFEAFAITCTVDDFDWPIDLTRADRDGQGDKLTYSERNTRRAWAFWQAATLAAQRQPLRGEQIHAIFLKTLPKQVLGMDYVPEWAIPVARAIEAAHEITAPPQGNPS